jgi:hypothetical protein
VLSRAFVTICISPLTVDNVQSDKAGDQYGHLELARRFLRERQADGQAR